MNLKECRQGQTDMVNGCTIDCIDSDAWYPRFHTDEQPNIVKR